MDPNLKHMKRLKKDENMKKSRSDKKFSRDRTEVN